MKQSLALPENLYQLLGFVAFLVGTVYVTLQAIIYITKAYVEVQTEKFQRQKMETVKIVAFMNDFNACQNDIAMLKKNEELIKIHNAEILTIIDDLGDDVSTLHQNFTDFLINMTQHKQ